MTAAHPPPEPFSRPVAGVRTLTLNGAPHALCSGVRTVACLLSSRGLSGSPCAVEVNRELIPKSQHASHELHDGDTVELVTLVGGG